MKKDRSLTNKFMKLGEKAVGWTMVSIMLFFIYELSLSKSRDIFIHTSNFRVNRKIGILMKSLLLYLRESMTFLQKRGTTSKWSCRGKRSCEEKRQKVSSVSGA